MEEWTDQNFYAYFVDDPYFIQKASEQYWSIRPYLESLICDGGILDDDYAYLYESGMTNSAKWFYARGFETDYNMFKEYMQKRIDWLDTQFATEDSIIESLGNYSSSDNFQITQANTNTDVFSEHAAAQGVLTDDELVLNVNLLSEDISEFRIFINGLKHKSIILEEADKNSVEITIPADALTELSGEKNVITIYSIGMDGEYVGSNFTTVIKMDSEESENILHKGTPYTLTDDNVLSYSVDIPHIIINQTYGADNDGYCSHSFIELYNPTDKDVSLNGWALYYQSASGGKYSGEWEKLELQGTIHAYSSYLVRAKPVTKYDNVVYEVPKGDVEWSDLRMYNKGGTVLLSYMHDDIAGGESIYDNDNKTPLINGYVDMLSVSGNDTDTAENIAKEAAPYSEGTASQLQSKKKAIRRIAFTDTDNNSAENGDCEIIDYTFEASKYIEWAAPRNAAYGEWHALDVPKYTVTMYQNDGTDSCETAEITYTDKVTGLTEPEREGHTFKGWYTDPECEAEYDFDEIPVTDVVLYAGWDINQYTVTFIVDGDTEYDKQTVEYGDKVSKPDIPSKSGHDFTGWYDGDVLYDLELPVTDDLILYAGWDINQYTITFIVDGDTEYDKQTVEYSDKVSKPDIPSKSGHDFTGWYDGDVLYDFELPVTDDLILYAGWDINQYTVTFIIDGDTEYDKQTVEYSDKVSKPDIPSKSGYYFTGWYDGDVLYDFELPVTNDLILYAGWDTELQRMDIIGVTDGSLSQSVNTVSEYKIQLNPESMPYSAIAMEIDGSSAIKAELEQDTLKIDTADAVVGDGLSVKFFNTVVSTENERIYINGGNFTINAADPILFINSVPDVSVKGADDVSVTLCVRAPGEIEHFVKGQLYYKLEAVPYADAEDMIPDEIRRATAAPVYVKANGETQQIELVVNDAEYGKGQNWKYDITVSLLLVMDEALPGDADFADKILYASRENRLTDIETRKTNVGDSSISFELQEQNTIIYTGQSDLAVATVLWNEANVINELGEVRDITVLGRGTKGGCLTVSEADGKIIVSAPKGTEPGVHTIEAVSYGPDKIYKVRQVMSIVVLKGIETLEVSVPSTRIYKQNGRQVQINAAIRYNDGMAEPKLERVIWQITDVDGNPLDSSSPLNGMISISGGKIVVDKNLIPAKESEKNCFRIMVKADDYRGNETYALSDVMELSDSKLTIGSIVLLRYNPENEAYETMDVSQQLTADIVDNAAVVSLAAGSPNQASYTLDEIQKYQVPCSAVQYKSSNSKLSIAIEDGGAALHVGQVTGKVTITATAADGGKQKASVKLNLTYAKPADLAVAMQDKSGTALGDSDAKEVSFAGTTNTVISLQVNAKTSAESAWEPLWAYTNYTLKVSGGKILESDALKGKYDIVVTGEKATIILSDKVNKVKKTYTLTNYAYSKLAAPTVKQVGTLEAGSLKDRSIILKLSGKYDYTGKSVIIETDATQKTSKNKKANYYTNLDSASALFGECSAVSPDGSITINFDSTFIYASSYKLKMTFGVVDENGVFIADAKPVSQTLKVKAAKAVKGSFKLTTSYKLKADAGESVLLTGTGKEIKAYDVRNLTNVTSKGTENKITDYFQIRGNQLCLREDLSAGDIAYLATKDGQKNLTGYVTYTAYHGDNGYGEPYITAKTVKITVKLTDF